MTHSIQPGHVTYTNSRVGCDQSAFQKIQAALGEPALRYLQKLASAVYLQSTRSRTNVLI